MSKRVAVARMQPNSITACERNSDDGCDSEDDSREDKDVVPHHTPEDAFTAFRMLQEYMCQSLPHLASEVLNLKQISGCPDG